jgi:sugar phosphate isomerase/epimerase
MYVGILTGPFSDTPLEHVAAFAGEYAFGGLEVVAGPGSKHIDTDNFTEETAASILDLMSRRNLEISAVGAYTNVTDGDPDRRARNIQTLHNAIDAANLMGVEVVTTLAGLPPQGKDRYKTIEEDCTAVFPALIEHAAEKHVKIALENWTATNIQHLGHWQKLFEVLPQPNFGLNFDPSHLVWQDIDHLEAVERFANRIFHSHAKDTEIRHHQKRIVGNQGHGWWRYVIPGLGLIKWGEYIGALRRNGYNGVLSIEHEDDAVEREEGFLIAKKNLEQYIAY